MDSRWTPGRLQIQYQEFTWTPDGVHQDPWLSVTTSSTAPSHSQTSLPPSSPSDSTVSTVSTVSSLFAPTLGDTPPSSPPPILAQITPTTIPVPVARSMSPAQIPMFYGNGVTCKSVFYTLVHFSRL